MSNFFTTPWTTAHQAPLSMDFPGKNTGLGCHFLLQGTFLTQGSNLGLRHCKQIFFTRKVGFPGKVGQTMLKYKPLYWRKERWTSWGAVTEWVSFCPEWTPSIACPPRGPFTQATHWPRFSWKEDNKCRKIPKMWRRALTFLKHHEVHDHSSYHLLSIYYVPATILGNLQVSIDLIFKATSWGVNIPIIQMKKLRLRTIHSLASDHPASKVLNQWFHFQIPWWMVDTQVCYLPMKKNDIWK